MSDIDILRSEKTRREQEKEGMLEAKIAAVEAIKQIKAIDGLHKSNLDLSRDILEGVYLETRFYTGEWPIVYSEADLTKYTYYQGPENIDCNPYYRMKGPVSIESGDKGIEPIPSGPTRVEGADGTINGINRKRSSFLPPAASGSMIG